MSLSDKINSIGSNTSCGPFCFPCETPQPKPLSGEARNGHAKVEQQADDYGAKYRQNDVENPTATNAFDFPNFEAQKRERMERRER